MLTNPVLIQFTHIGNNYIKYGDFLCKCGVMFNTVISKVNQGSVKSCGCSREGQLAALNTTHGMSYHPIIGSYYSMHQRCYNKNKSCYKNYGGRGIIVCDRWFDSCSFINDMLSTWFKEATLDRIDNDGNYEPSNCRWLTRSENTRIANLRRGWK